MDLTKYSGSESKYLRAKDIKGRRLTLRIQRVELVEFDDDGKKKTKPVIFFHGKEKGVVLSGQNVERLGAALDTYNSDDWVDKDVELSTMFYPNLDADGIIVDALKQDFDDDLPF